MIPLVVATLLAAVADDDRVLLTITRIGDVSACPDDAELRDRVRARIGSEPFRDELAQDAGARARTLHVQLTRDASLLMVRIDLDSPAGARARRELSGPLDCQLVADELVLAIAIAVDPLLLMRPAPTAAQPAARPAAQAAAQAAAQVRVPAPPEDADARAAQEGVYAGRRGDLPIVVEPAAPFNPPRPNAAWVRAGAGVSTMTSPVPTQTMRAEASLDYGPVDVDVGARFDLPSTFFVAGGGALRLTVIAAHLAPCLAVALGAIRLRGCEVNEAGSLIAEGDGLADGIAAAHPWIAVGGRAAIDLPVTSDLWLFFAGDTLVPLLRPRLVNRVDGALWYQPPALAVLVGFGVMARIE